MFCCEQLQGKIENAGDRGIAVLVRELSPDFIFYLQSRAVKFGEEVELSGMKFDHRLNLISSVGIQWCPWCNQNLAKLAESNPSEFSDLARSHERLVPAIP